MLKLISVYFPIILTMQAFSDIQSYKHFCISEKWDYLTGINQIQTFKSDTFQGFFRMGHSRLTHLG